MRSSALSVGALVNVKPESRRGRPNSEGGMAYVLEVNEDNDLTVDVRYVVSNTLSQEVLPTRLKPASLAVHARKKSKTELARPSLLSIAHKGQALPVTPSSSSPATPKGLVSKLAEAVNWDSNSNKRHPVFTWLMKQRKMNEEGWLRRTEATIAGRDIPKPKSHLLAVKRRFLVEIEILRRALPTNYGNNSFPLSDHAFAWGIKPFSLKRIYTLAMKRNNDVKRKTRNDKGLTIFNSQKKRQQVFRPYEVYKRHQRAINPGEVFTDQELCTGFDKLDPVDTARVQNKTDELLDQAAFLPSEISRLLQKSDGQITWRKLAELLAGGRTQIKPASHNTLCKFCMSLEGSEYKTTKILPLLTPQTVKERLHWAQSWFWFWNGAQTFSEKCRVLLVHNDEKWFFALVQRRHLTHVPLLGCVPKAHGIHHKSHIGKILGISTVGYLSYFNDVVQGGEGIKIDMERAGGMVRASRDSYKRVYRDDGTYHYPQIPENILRRKGQEYFEN